MKNFEQYVDLTNIKDSLELDSGTEIACAEICNGKYLIVIEVRGEVHISFKGEVYRRPSDFPKELMNIIRNGALFNCSYENDCVLYGNWFEIFVIDKDENTVLCDVVDVEGCSEKELMALFQDFEQYLDKCIKADRVSSVDVVFDEYPFPFIKSEALSEYLKELAR